MSSGCSRSSSPAWSSYEYDDECLDVPPSKTLRGALSKISCLRRGSQGTVYLARDRSTGDVVAVKRIFLDYRRQRDRGYSELALREVSVLSMLSASTSASPFSSENIVRFHGVVYAPGNEICLVMEHCPVDLASIVSAARDVTSPVGVMLTMDTVRYIMRCLLGALAHLHDSCCVLHRDVKPGNLLLTSDGAVRLSDFGSSRTFIPDISTADRRSSGRLTPGSLRTTLLFAAPELLMGSLHYGGASDVWSAGVTFAELLLRDHLFKARSELIMISSIFQLVGAPTAESWPEFSQLPVAQTFEFQALPSSLDQALFKAGKIPHAMKMTPACRDLLERLLTANPARRISCAEALRHPFFAERDDVASGNGEDASVFYARMKQQCAQLVKLVVESQNKRKLPSAHLMLAAVDSDEDDE